MNKSAILGLVAFSIVAASCGSSGDSGTSAAQDTAGTEGIMKQDTLAAAPVSDTMKVTGVISKIENGKDGYMATLKDPAGKEFIATISIINLQKSGGQFKRYKEGDKITVAGPGWKDDAGQDHIMVTSLE